jgi:hypothetical protein
MGQALCQPDTPGVREYGSTELASFEASEAFLLTAARQGLTDMIAFPSSSFLTSRLK